MPLANALRNAKARACQPINNKRAHKHTRRAAYFLRSTHTYGCTVPALVSALVRVANSRTWRKDSDQPTPSYHWNTHRRERRPALNWKELGQAQVLHPLVEVDRYELPRLTQDFLERGLERRI